MTGLRTRLLARAMQGAGSVPEPLARGVAELAAVGVGAAVRCDAGAFDQLRRNLARLRPDLAEPGDPGDPDNDEHLDDLVAENLRRYLRYYAEMLTLGGARPDQIRARMDMRGFGPLAERFRAGDSVVVALGHTGNWDLAGAWMGLQDAQLVTVAEHLEPEEVYRGFLQMRESLGMHVITLGHGGGTFRALLREARRSAPALVALLADRDLSRQGVRVELCGAPARVAAGPAALAKALRVPLYVASVCHRPLRGAERIAAGAPWGIEVRISDPVDTGGEIADVTQRWVDVFAEAIAARPADWHMLQPVWEADMDPARTRAPQAVSARARALADAPPRKEDA